MNDGTHANDIIAATANALCMILRSLDPKTRQKVESRIQGEIHNFQESPSHTGEGFHNPHKVAEMLELFLESANVDDSPETYKPPNQFGF